MGKMKVVLGIVALGAVAVLGVFYFLTAKPAIAPHNGVVDGTVPQEELRDPNEIVIEGNRFTDTRQGYSGVIPEGWEIRKPERISDGVDLYNPDVFLSEEASFKTGCKIQSGFALTTKTAQEMIQDTEENSLPFLTVEKYEQSNLEIDGYAATKIVLISKEFGYSEAVYVDITERVYAASLFSGDEAIQTCSETFLNFLLELYFT